MEDCAGEAILGQIKRKRHADPQKRMTPKRLNSVA